MGALKISFAVVLATAFFATAFLPVQSDGMQAGSCAVDGMPVVVLTGTPEERGLSYGWAAGPMIQGNLEMF